MFALLSLAQGRKGKEKYDENHKTVRGEKDGGTFPLRPFITRNNFFLST